MDAVTTKLKQDLRPSALLQTALILFFLLLYPTTSFAQFIGIRCQSPPQDLVHDLISSCQHFPESRWDVHNSVSQSGIAVVWTAEAFQSQTGKYVSVADTGLQLRIHGAVPAGTWNIIQGSDQTNIGKGHRAAFVSAASAGFGEATMGVTVTYNTSHTSIPTAGQYRTQLTGTIVAP